MATKSSVPADTTNNDVVSNQELMDAQTFSEILDYYGEAIIKVDQARPVDKAELVNKPFVVINWAEGKNNKFDTENGFIVVRVITKDDEKVFFTDGGAGITAQLRDIFARTDRRGGILIEKGLRASNYTVKDTKGKDVDSTTYYLS